MMTEPPDMKESRRIYRMRLDGSAPELIIEAQGTGYITSDWMIDGGVLYYYMHTEGENSVPIGDGQYALDLATRTLARIDIASDFIEGGWAYTFVGEEMDDGTWSNNLIRTNLTSGEVQPLPGVRDWGPVDVCAGWLFYSDLDGNGPLMRRLDGSGSPMPVPLAIPWKPD